MCLTGRMMDAAEAERCGLVSRVVPARDLLRDARATAAKIAEKSPLAGPARSRKRSTAATRRRCARGCSSSAGCSTRSSPPRTRPRAWRPSPRSAARSSAENDARNCALTPAGGARLETRLNFHEDRIQTHGQYAVLQEARAAGRAPRRRQQGAPLADAHLRPQGRGGDRRRRAAAAAEALRLAQPEIMRSVSRGRAAQEHRQPQDFPPGRPGARRSAPDARGPGRAAARVPGSSSRRRPPPRSARSRVHRLASGNCRIAHAHCASCRDERCSAFGPVVGDGASVLSASRNNS